jgi:hypothetical protein
MTTPTETDPEDDAEMDSVSTDPVEPEDVSLGELRDEIAAGTAENRRTARRTFEVLKQFGAVLDAMSNSVNDLHRGARTTTPAPPSPADPGMPRAHLLGLIELADRLQRLDAAFERRPAAGSSWLPTAKKALGAWDAAWSTQSEALGMVSLHLEGLLKNAGIERVRVTGEPFDPARMTAVETVQDGSRPDHTVVAELLAGWQRADTAEIVRLAQVRVSRR